MASALPRTFRKMIVSKLTQNFKEAVTFQTVPMLKPGPGDLLIRNRFVGINASDINFTAGRYDPTARPPFDIGFEGVGEVVDVGSDVQKFEHGQGVAYMSNGAFAEYVLVPANIATPVPATKAEYVPFLVSGRTADISLQEFGKLKAGETVLVTAAAGGTGQFAVQLAKAAGCHVIGTCSTQSKVDFLKSIGCDRPINYTEEKLADVLKKEYPGGLDVVYESIGGPTFETCIKSLGFKGRLIVIGYISGYESDQGFIASVLNTLPQRLLSKSASVCGFLLFHYANRYSESFKRLISMYEDGKLKAAIDNGKNNPSGRFVGVASVVDAVKYMYTKKSEGKIVVELNPEETSKL
ncbi:prostaglandin reductase-3-like [Anneissia japonica]|uniref:prostaglandin reductase-3-like n=1 Tax=Anneissia japonica TaxID=1529436 RepID=UPI001425A5B9|nr:prostaglandin reductase-3-like [Anneissia japonica]